MKRNNRDVILMNTAIGSRQRRQAMGEGKGWVDGWMDNLTDRKALIKATGA